MSHLIFPPYFVRLIQRPFKIKFSVKRKHIVATIKRYNEIELYIFVEWSCFRYILCSNSIRKSKLLMQEIKKI